MLDIQRALLSSYTLILLDILKGFHTETLFFILCSRQSRFHCTSQVNDNFIIQRDSGEKITWKQSKCVIFLFTCYKSKLSLLYYVKSYFFFGHGKQSIDSHNVFSQTPNIYSNSLWSNITHQRCIFYFFFRQGLVMEPKWTWSSLCNPG